MDENNIMKYIEIEGKIYNTYTNSDQKSVYVYTKNLFDGILTSKKRNIPLPSPADRIDDAKYQLELENNIAFYNDSLEPLDDIYEFIKNNGNESKDNPKKFNNIVVADVNRLFLSNDGNEDWKKWSKDEGLNNYKNNNIIAFKIETKSKKSPNSSELITYNDFFPKTKEGYYVENGVVKKHNEPVQKIIFGPPGTGKSQKVINMGFVDPIVTAFHPEYTYGDFIAKLMPISVGGKVEYRVVAGHFIKALAKALKQPNQCVLLQIEEINRGNCAAIFGDIFHLLDRDKAGKSEYRVFLSELATKALKQQLGINEEDEIKQFENEGGAYIPANLSIIATMNTSDESVYFMDSAFKRRWQFEYMDVNTDTNSNGDSTNNHQVNAQVAYNYQGGNKLTTWNDLREAINNFMKENSNLIRGIEDKQIGLWFLKANADGKIREEDIKYKLMHYLWDNVFLRDKKPLTTLINKLLDKNTQDTDETQANQGGNIDLVTFGDFLKNCDTFILKVCKFYSSENNNRQK